MIIVGTVGSFFLFRLPSRMIEILSGSSKLKSPAEITTLSSGLSCALLAIVVYHLQILLVAFASKESLWMLRRWIELLSWAIVEARARPGRSWVEEKVALPEK